MNDLFKETKFWLTGSSGLVGSNIANHLISRNHKVVRISNQINKGSNIHMIDYRNRGQIINLTNNTCIPDVLIHAGWGGMTEPESKIHINENVENSVSLFKNLLDLGLKRIIFIGSIEEYGCRNGKLTETMKPVGKLRNYEKGKIKVGILGMKLAEEKNITYIHVRLANIYGFPQKSGSLISSLHAYHENNKKPSFGPCANARDYIYVDDAVLGIYCLSNINGSVVVNLGSGKMTIIKDFTKKYWEELGGNSNEIVFGKDYDKNEVRKVEMDISNITKITEWVPRYTIEDGIKKMVAMRK